MAGKKACIKPMLKKLLSKIDLEEPTQITVQTYLMYAAGKRNKQKKRDG